MLDHVFLGLPSSYKNNRLGFCMLIWRKMRKISILELGKWDSNSEWGREGLIEDQVLKEEERIRVMAKKENLGRKKKDW